MTTLKLGDKPNIAELQQYVAEMVRERGFGEESVSERFMLLVEEVGEFAKSARKHTGLKLDTRKPVDDGVALEAADVPVLSLVHQPYNDASHPPSAAPATPADLHHTNGYASDTSNTPGTTADDWSMYQDRVGGVLGICNMLFIDLEHAFRDKGVINQARIWE